jgi:hypothetical protein
MVPDMRGSDCSCCLGCHDLPAGFSRRGPLLSAMGISLLLWALIFVIARAVLFA